MDMLWEKFKWNVNLDCVLFVSRYIQSKPYLYINDTTYSHKVLLLLS